MLRPIAILFSAFLAAAVHAQEASYLADPGRFQAAFAQVTTAAAADLEIAEILCDADELLVIARAPGNTPGLVRWYVKDVEFLGLHANKMSGPDPFTSTKIKPRDGMYFAAADVPLDRFQEIVRHAGMSAGLANRARSGVVRIRRDPETAEGSLGWTIALDMFGERATIYTTAHGRVLGADMTETERWRGRYFVTQAAWPFGRAQDAFRSVVGSAPLVARIVVGPKDITMTAATAADPAELRNWVWDGGSYSEPLHVGPVPAVAAPANLRFSLDEVDLTQIERIRDMAMQAIGPDALIVSELRLVPSLGADATPQVTWEVDVKVPGGGTGFPQAKIATVVFDGNSAVARVILPGEKAALADWTRPDAFVGVIAALQQAFGKDAEVYQLLVWPERATVKAPHPTRKHMTLSNTLNDEGLGKGSDFPVTTETEEDLFTLGALSAIDAALVASIREKAVKAIGIEGAEVYRITLWSGHPFWSDPKGRPMFDVRVAEPPDFYGGGYAVFSLDGKLIKAIK